MDLQRELKRIIAPALIFFLGNGIAYAFYHQWFICGAAINRCISNIVVSSTWMLMGAVILVDQIKRRQKKKGCARISPQIIMTVLMFLIFGCIALTFSVINLKSGCGDIRFGC